VSGQHVTIALALPRTTRPAGRYVSLWLGPHTGPPIALAPTSLPSGQSGSAYSQTISASGGASPHAFDVVAGALPSGLSLASGGALTGTPSVSGTYAFTVRALDATPIGLGGPYAGVRAYTLTIREPGTIEPPSVSDVGFGTPAIAFTQTVSPGALDALAAGGPVVYNFLQFASPAGIADGAYGASLVYNAQQFASPAGIFGEAFGTGLAYNLTQTVSPPGGSYASFGTQWTDYADRSLVPAGINGQSIPDPFVAFEIRHMRPLPVQQEQFGSTIVDQQNKTVQPATFASTSFGGPFVSFKDRSITVGAGDLLIVPIHAVLDPRQYVHQSGASHGSVPTPSAGNRNVELHLPSSDMFAAGAAVAYNLWQVVLHIEDYQFPGDVGAVTASNFNKTLYPEGIDSLRMRPYHEARLLADPAGPAPIDSFESGDVVVSNYYRSLPVAGIDAFGGSRATVSNAAIGVYAAGSRHDLHGAAAAVDGTRELYPLLPRQDSYGSARASLSPIVVTEVQGVVGGACGSPRASLSPLIVTPAWPADAITGAVLLQIKFNRIEPLAFPSSTPPAPTVMNRNRYVRPFAPIEEIGLQRAVLMRQIASIEGVSVAQFGSPLARDRTTRVTPTGIIEPSTTGTTVNKYPPDPPPNLIISLYGAGGSVGLPLVIDFTVRPTWADDAAVSQPRIFSNTIVVPGLIEDHTANTLHSIPSRAPVPVAGFASDEYGTHACSPYTVWATFAAPSQAVANHGGRAWRLVDDPLGVAFPAGVGSPVASNLNQTVYQTNPDPDPARVGDAAASNKRQYSVPKGFLSQRIPAPTIPNPGPVLVSGIGGLEFGYLAAGFAPEAGTREVRCSGISGDVAAPVASNYIRYVQMSSEDAALVGAPAVNHELEPFRMTGFDGFSFTDADVGHRIREFRTEGFDGTLMGPTVGSFARGMRIYRLDRIRPQWVAQAQFGTAKAQQSTTFVGVTEIAPLPVMPPRLQHTASTGDWPAGIIGAHRADAAIDGSVLGYGIDGLGIGRASTKFMLHIESVIGSIGPVSVADAVAVSGLYGAIGSASAVGGAGHTCGMLPRAVVSGPIDTAAVGEPSLV